MQLIITTENIEERLMIMFLICFVFSTLLFIFAVVSIKLAGKRELEKNNAKKFQLNYL